MTAQGVVLLDTNQLPIKGDFGGAFWRSVRFLCATKGLRLALPDIVVHESVNLKTTEATAWAESFRVSHRNLSGIVALEPIYVPEPREMSRAWRDSLESAFEVIPVHGDDAMESLKREALREWPAQKGYGSRDSAIWLTVVRLAKTGAHVYLVTNNSQDFGKGDLRPELMAELSEVTGAVSYIPTVQAFVAAIATRIDRPTLSEDTATSLLAETARDRALEIRDVIDFESITLDDILDSTVIFSEIRAFDAYVIDSHAIANISGRFTLAYPGGLVFASGSFNTWLDYEPETGIFTSNDLGDVHIDFR